MRFTKRFFLKILACVALVVLLATTAYAFGYVFLTVRDNQFQTGTVDVGITKVTQNSKYIVNLFQEDPVPYEPGMTVRGDFIVENRSNDPNGIWYRVYVDGVTGELQDVMYAKVFSPTGALLLEGYMADLNGKRLAMKESQLLEDGGSVTLTMELHYEESAGNDTQEQSLEFNLGVVAVQRKNNPHADGIPG